MAPIQCRDDLLYAGLISARSVRSHARTPVRKRNFRVLTLSKNSYFWGLLWLNSFKFGYPHQIAFRSTAYEPSYDSKPFPIHPFLATITHSYLLYPTFNRSEKHGEKESKQISRDP